MSRCQARRRLVVLLCGAVGALHLALLVAVRVDQTQRDLEGMSGSWPALIAYSSYVAHWNRMEIPEAVAAADTVRALAPGTALGFEAAWHEAVALEGGGKPDAAARVYRYELARQWWPLGDSAYRLAFTASLNYRQRGMAEEDRRLAERAVDRVPWDRRSYFRERLAILLQQSGEPRAALAQLAQARRTASGGRVSREALLAGAAAERALGHLASATALETAARSARRMPAPLTPVEPSGLQGGGREAWLWTRAHVDARGVPTHHWWAVVSADLDVTATWLLLCVVLGLLTACPVERFGNSRWRPAAGALALCLFPVLIYVPPLSAQASMGLASPFGNGRTALWWSTVLFGRVLWGVILAVTIVESRSLGDLGWRRGPRWWAYGIGGAVIGGLLAWGYVRRVLALALGTNPWFPGLGQTPAWLPVLAATSCLVGVVAAFGEETLWRGYLLQALSGWLPRFWLVNGVQALLFAGLHLCRGSFVATASPSACLWQGLWYVLMALLAGWAVRKTGSLWPGAVFHFVFDALAYYGQLAPSYDLIRMAGSLASG
jgi:membrane protease YdiL (CAAX protease family)